MLICFLLRLTERLIALSWLHSRYKETPPSATGTPFFEESGFCNACSMRFWMAACAPKTWIYHLAIYYASKDVKRCMCTNAAPKPSQMLDFKMQTDHKPAGQDMLSMISKRKTKVCLVGAQGIFPLSQTILNKTRSHVFFLFVVSCIQKRTFLNLCLPR